MKEGSQIPSPLAGEGQLAQRAGRGGDILLANAKRMRRNPTEAERRLWSILRGKRLAGYKFKRQQPLGPFIVDFINFEHGLIIEADGSQHAENAADVRRESGSKPKGLQSSDSGTTKFSRRPTRLPKRSGWH